MDVRTYEFGGWPVFGCELVAVDEGDSDGLHAWARWVDERRAEVLAIDCETNALDPWQHGFRTRTVQVSDGLTAWVVPVWTSDGVFTAGEVVADVVRRHPRWIAHYAEHDERFLCRGLGLRWDAPDPVRWDDAEPHFWDTQVLLGVADPRTVTTHSKKDRIHPRIPLRSGLKPTAERELGTDALTRAESALHARFREIAPRGYRGGGAKTRAWGFANVALDDPAFRLYALLDPLATARLYRLLRARLEAAGRWDRCVASLAKQWVTDGATYRGMPVDEAYARWLDADLERVCAEQQSVLGPAGVGVSGQGPAVGRAFHALGVTSPKTGDDGAESWDREALVVVAERAETFLADYVEREFPVPGSELAVPDAMHADIVHRVSAALSLTEAVQATRRASKYRGTWVAPMLRSVTEADGASHPLMRGLGTVTTRMAAYKSFTSGPLHSAPKREETRLRACYRAPQGWVWVSADLRQGEPYVMAARSGCPDYLAWLVQGDINGRMAGELYEGYDAAQGKVAGTEHFHHRQAVKFGWLAACYGAGDRKVDTLIGLPGSGVLARWRSWFPRFWEYADWCNRQAVIQLDSGHRIPLWDRVGVDDVTGALYVRHDPSRLGLNADTQGTQADVLEVAIHRHRHAGWHWALRFFVHDELVALVPDWMAPAYRDFLEAAMTVTFRGVAIGCEATIDGPTWMPQTGMTIDVADLAAVDEVEDGE